MGNINKAPEATEEGVWGWYNEPELERGQKGVAREMTESLAAAHELIALFGGIAISELANTACAYCMHHMQKSYCAGCLRKYR